MVDPIRGAMEPRPLHPDHGSGEADIESVTDEIDEAQPQDATAEPGVPSVIAQLGVEARAEYIRARQRLGLADEPAERLGTVGRYRLEAELGRGGMGIVFRASDPELDRPVAIKLVQAVPFARYDKLRTRLLREAKVLAKLTHPNVVRVYDCGQHEGEVYLAMELVEGATLRDWQRGRSRSSILDAYQQAARGLAAAHELGITHRDFKPDNALVASDGRVLVGDFGLAGVLAGDELRTEGSAPEASPGERVSATRSGALLGTPTYMAPEQLRGEVATPLSDQFAFCVSLWEALTGLRPFEGDKREELLEQIEQRRVRGSERLPRRLRARLMRGLAVEPDARFGHLQELAEALMPRRGRMVTAAALSVSLGVGLVVGAWFSREDPPPCVLPAMLDNIAAMPEWERVRERPELGPLYEDLQDLTQSMRAEAETLCQTSTDDEVVRREWLKSWIDYLRFTLADEPEKDLGSLQEAIRLIENERWHGPPQRRLAEGVDKLLHKSYVLQLNNDLQGALSRATDALTETGAQDLERASTHQRRGRILALMGRHGEAMTAYREATSHSKTAFPSFSSRAFLGTELLAAKTAAMRLGELERARDFLAAAHGSLNYLHEPLLSPRRADYHEILAAILKHEGKLDAALVHQAYAVLVFVWWREPLDLGRGYVNLGTIFELRNHGTDIDLARFWYERALETLADRPWSPEWFQAAFNLGHWLVQNGRKDEWPRAKSLLERVHANSGDAKPSALTDLVLLAIKEEDATTAHALAGELEALLHGDSSRSLSAERRIDAWQNIATAHAMAADLAAFENARAAFDHVLEGPKPAQVDDIQQETAALDLTAAGLLKDTAPERALDLATSVQAYLVPLPEARRPPGMLEATEKLITELRTSISPSTHP